MSATRFVVSFYNLYATMPSLHFGWALLVGLMAYSSGRRWLKAVGAVYPCCMALVIILTAHHYFLDVIGGGTVVGLTYAFLVKIVPRVSYRETTRAEHPKHT